jgi:hypothetical protein
MNYSLITETKPTLERAPTAPIALNPWNISYTPETDFCGVYVKGQGFLFRLSCKETNPRITYSGAGGEVCEDSCLELFLNFAPESSANYINFEMNAGGAYLFGIGPDRDNRVDLQTAVMPTVEPKIETDHWEVTLFIPLETVEEAYGPIDFVPGTRFVGNAYKCGDLTEIPHFLTWNPVKAAEPDFHRPECFGSFTIAE